MILETFPSVSRSPRHLLVTGGAGFIGSNFVQYWCKKYPRDLVVVLDALTYSGNEKNLEGLKEQLNYRFVRGNISDRTLVDALLEEEKITTLVHFAAESHVDRSIVAPDAFIHTNLVGTFTLLESFRNYLKNLDTESSKIPPDSYRFLHISTDEVFGSLGENDPPFSETTPYQPNSPYSASKAGSDHLVRSYYHTYNLPTLITNCSNNYGPYQFPEKFIPHIITNILLGKSLPIYGDGKNVRDWLYVLDHCQALETVIQDGKPGETYNIGGNNEQRNIDLVKSICKMMDELVPEIPISPSEQLITFVKDRPGHDRRYAINSTKIQTELGWTPSVTLEEGLKETLRWYINNSDWWQPLLFEEYWVDTSES